MLQKVRAVANISQRLSSELIIRAMVDAISSQRQCQLEYFNLEGIGVSHVTFGPALATTRLLATSKVFLQYSLASLSS